MTNEAHRIQFGTLLPTGEVVNRTSLKQSDVRKCPHYILMPEHYRQDGTCRCNDAMHNVMQAWGYRWSKKQERWK